MHKGGDTYGDDEPKYSPSLFAAFVGKIDEDEIPQVFKAISDFIKEAAETRGIWGLLCRRWNDPSAQTKERRFSSH